MPEVEGAKLAVVLPAHRHPALLPEAIESVLAQQADFPIHLIMVNDGCPFTETDRVCRSYACAYPDRVTYLRQPNRGLPAARNAGLQFVLDHLPAAEAIYLLDADNRLRPQALARAMAELQAHPEAGWIYPDFDMFGTPFHGDPGGPYSRLLHAAQNICEAGSLLRREVIKAVQFDPDFRRGWEDWAFFLAAAQAGFRGRHLEDFGFEYRKRPESLLAQAGRDEAGLRTQLRDAHSWLMNPRALASLEHAEAPRFAILFEDTEEAFFATDPARLGAPVPDLGRAFWASRTGSTRFHFPGYVVATTRAAYEILRQAGVLHWVFWALQCRAMAAECAVLELVAGARFAVSEGEGQAASGAVVLASSAASTGARIRKLRLTLPSTAPPPSVHFHPLSERLRHSEYACAAGLSWEWRRGDLPLRHRAHEVLERAVGGVAACVLPQGVQVGFALARVDAAAADLAQELRRRGVGVHLFILGHAAEPAPDFDSVHFLSDWQDAAAQMFWLDAVIAQECDAFGALKRLGIGTVCLLPDVPYPALDFEHAVDVFAVRGEGGLVCALGVPGGKVLPLDQLASWLISRYGCRAGNQKKKDEKNCDA